MNNIPVLCTKLFKKSGTLYKGDIIQGKTLFKKIRYFYEMCVTIFNKSRENVGARKKECYFRNDLSPLCEITTQVDFSSQKALSSSYLNDLLSLGPSTHYSLRLKRFIDSRLHIMQLHTYLQAYNLMRYTA